LADVQPPMREKKTEKTVLLVPTMHAYMADSLRITVHEQRITSPQVVNDLQ
jgi:hypothetical protein